MVTQFEMLISGKRGELAKNAHCECQGQIFQTISETVRASVKIRAMSFIAAVIHHQTGPLRMLYLVILMPLNGITANDVLHDLDLNF